jgi:hypothetical protein
VAGDKVRSIIAQVEDEPNCDESQKAVKKRDKELFENVSIENGHGIV